MDVISIIKLCDQVMTESDDSKREVKEASKLIHELCKDHSLYVVKKSYALIKHVIFHSILHNENPQPYLNILQFINESVRYPADKDGITSSSDEEQFNHWKEIIVIAYSVREDSNLFKEKSIPSHFSKQIDFSESCKRLSEFGIGFEFHNDNILIGRDSQFRVLEKIDEYINAIGGEQVLNLTFQLLSNSFVPPQERFQVFRKTTHGIDYPQPDIPWGYVIALGAKNVHRKSRCLVSNVIQEYKSFIAFMTDIVTTFEIQPYIIWEAVHVDNLRVVEFLQENILYDNLISFFQLKSTYAKEIIKNISVSWSGQDLKSYGFTLSDIISIGVSIIELSSDTNTTLISKSKLSKLSGVKINVLDKIIDVIFTSKNSGELGFPPSSESIDHVLAPLLPFNGLFMTLPKSITSLSVLNCVLNQISKPDGLFDNARDSSVGVFLEEFVWGKVRAQGVRAYRGDYISKNKRIRGDCDLLIRTDDFIYIFEIKKKSLTRKAMSGTDYHIIKDLGDSVMRSQAQCAKIEYVLLSDKELTLKSQGGNETIKYTDQRIFKVSLSLHDFGALQDNTTLSTILRIASQVRFKTDDSEVNVFLTKWHEYVDSFNNYRAKSKGLQKHEDDLFRSNIFMSVPQLLTILDESHDENEFSDLCKGSISISYSTRCFYREFSLRRRLRNI